LTNAATSTTAAESLGRLALKLPAHAQLCHRDQ
jgi:hypothetical protein